MKKVFLDTNVLLDYLLDRGDSSHYATIILQIANSKLIELRVTDLTIANIAYITRKDIPLEEFYRVIKILRKYIAVIPIGQDVIDRALNEEWRDFEDCIQYLSAKNDGVDYLITSNTKDFLRAEIPVFTPKEFIESISDRTIRDSE